MQIKVFGIGDTLHMKKNHACDKNAKTMTVLMAGSDVKIKCDFCGREMIVPRVKIEKSIKNVTRKEQ